MSALSKLTSWLRGSRKVSEDAGDESGAQPSGALSFGDVAELYRHYKASSEHVLPGGVAVEGGAAPAVAVGSWSGAAYDARGDGGGAAASAVAFVMWRYVGLEDGLLGLARGGAVAPLKLSGLQDATAGAWLAAARPSPARRAPAASAARRRPTPRSSASAPPAARGAPRLRDLGDGARAGEAQWVAEFADDGTVRARGPTPRTTAPRTGSRATSAAPSLEAPRPRSSRRRRRARGACCTRRLAAGLDGAGEAVVVSKGRGGFERWSYGRCFSAGRDRRRCRRWRGPGYVGVLLDRGPELVAGLLGVLASGAAYVPLDKVYPTNRLEAMLEDSKAVVTITAGDLGAKIAGFAQLDVGTLDLTKELPVDEDAEDASERWFGTRLAKCTRDDVAYCLFTSGSTGRPRACPSPTGR
ncbi:hypothetical protein JL721_5958 [Aureococcus anophagefferens]|nr:hypothetical protein JL721_5958 [Aureococcus anophagefferens]